MTDTRIPIPPEVVDAFLRELNLTADYRAAIAACLAAWPGGGMSQFHDDVLCLPLPQEARDG